LERPKAPVCKSFSTHAITLRYLQREIARAMSNQEIASAFGASTPF
jgi:hypothetical protein